MSEYKLRYHQWSEFVAACEGSTDFPTNMRASRDEGRNDWASGSWEDAIEALHNGWSSVRPEIDAMTEAIEDEIRDKLVSGFREVYDVAGGGVDIGRFMSGDPDSMVTLIPMSQPKQGRVTTILVNVGFSAGVSETEIKRRGAAICALIESLERVNMTVELWCEEVVAHTDRRVHSTSSILVRVKPATETLDMDKVMFAVACPMMLRRAIFSLQECQDATYRREIGIGGGYGHPENVTKDAKSVCEPDITLDLMGYDSRMRTGADAVQWVRDNLSKIGVWAE